ncbi:glycoside hydrolase domain-containing protein [Pedobacter sp. CFBP9032]|uniref:glycoside hydrolase domain-containing protein n=1 Tax=Pedobacter sp. CFBP9032 TaxID=3096539 RepID=UPI002A6A964A|nr:glycoside hydrolase domain-containing protein [Pedobacter sp. CFBP9032]MDY0907021.1 glycoside hydrolase family 92 protein [Pedobacter sp. CFBP9032]
MKTFIRLTSLFLLFQLNVLAQQNGNNFNIKEKPPVELVNVFLGSSGDHGQMSPAASYPFSMLSIGPQTYPKTHTGYEYLAKKFDGFTHNRFEGVGCQGSGGNILIKPFLGDDPAKTELLKVTEKASPGYYAVGFENKISVELSVLGNAGKHIYQFPKGKKGYYLDLSYAFNNAFVDEQHQVDGNTISGWITSKTTCSVGKYKIYYSLSVPIGSSWKDNGNHQLILMLPEDAAIAEINVALSSVSAEAAALAINAKSFDQFKLQSAMDWNRNLKKIEVKGNLEDAKLFYSLLYRTMQSPYVISSPNGQYRDTKGELNKDKQVHYNGWAIWDNYRTQLPLLSIINQNEYAGMVSSIAELYQSGKKDYAGQNEPSNTVRSEHAIVVLLDAYRKGYPVDFKKIADSLVKEVNGLDYKSPDKALETSYDHWALSEIFTILKNKKQADFYKDRALEYRKFWNKDFKDLSKSDVDRMQARGLYQGTIWQYRWFVPYDFKGLVALDGGEETYLAHLDEFFAKDLYNHANEPDLQVPLMYNVTRSGYKSQYWMRQLAADTVIQNYFNDNSRGIGSYIGKIYKNEPQAYLRTMDDDAGAMSAWYIFTASGFSPACVGWPVYYLNVPLFPSLTYHLPKGKTFRIETENFDLKNKYIQAVFLNGKPFKRNYLTQEEINTGGILKIVAAADPVKISDTENWISSIEN